MLSGKVCTSRTLLPVEVFQAYDIAHNDSKALESSSSQRKLAAQGSMSKDYMYDLHTVFLLLDLPSVGSMLSATESVAAHVKMTARNHSRWFFNTIPLLFRII